VPSAAAEEVHMGKTMTADFDEMKAATLAVHIAKAIAEGRKLYECNDLEVAAGIGVVVARLGGTNTGVGHIAMFARRHLAGDQKTGQG